MHSPLELSTLSYVYISYLLVGQVVELGDDPDASFGITVLREAEG